MGIKGDIREILSRNGATVPLGRDFDRLVDDLKSYVKDNFIPLPKYTNGKSIHFGDVFRSFPGRHKVVAIQVFKNGAYILKSRTGKFLTLDPGERLEPQPQYEIHMDEWLDDYLKDFPEDERDSIRMGVEMVMARHRKMENPE